MVEDPQPEDPVDVPDPGAISGDSELCSNFEDNRVVVYWLVAVACFVRCNWELGVKLGMTS
jgi:hypothetical protein